MAFRSVGDLAVEVLRNANLAARGHDAVHELGTGQPGEEIPTSPSKASTEQGVTGGNAVMKRTGAETPASDARGVVRQTTASLEEVASVASLPVGRSIVMVSKAVAPRKRQAPKVSAMIIDLAIYREARAHAALANSP
jgi:hypothetical protein